MINPYETILKEVASGMLETAEIKPNFSNNALLDATLIFQTVFMDKFYDKYKDYTLENQEYFANKAGKELRKLIKDFTGLDTHELTKNYNNER
jgi:deoxyadenosine/deoxycytidine kinase